MLVPVAAAALVLAAALAGYVMVKFYGIIFLGQPREEKVIEAHDIGAWERAGLIWLALGCILLGVFPVFVILHIDPVTQMLVGQTLGSSAAQTGWLLLTPIQPERASYSPLILFLIIIVGVVFTMFVVKKFYHGRLRRGPAWDCGFPSRRRGCRTPQKVSASRSGRYSSCSSASPAKCPAHSTRTPITGAKHATACGTSSTCPSPGSPKRFPRWSADCSTVAFTFTCFTAS